jgi:hypothetical protein
MFDVEGYDYILNKNTIFTQGTLCTHQYEKLHFILKNYKELNPILLELLHYKSGGGELPLHKALFSKNNRMVNLILAFMAKIEFSAIHHIQDIFAKLISFPQFE